MTLREIVEVAASVTETAGVALILGGLVLATARTALVAPATSPPRFERYRRDLGRAIVLGLEVLVAADIIRTVAFTPTTDSVLALATIVLIRTFLSWSLALELDGRWPWQRRTSADLPPNRGARS